MKNIFRKKTNPKIITIIIIIGVIVFGTTMPIFAHASIWTFLGIDSAAKSLIIGIGTAINHVLSWIMKAGSAFFEGMLNVGFNSSTMKIVQDGWRTCRDFANMLFILFMIIIAFATILRIEGYGIKKLLPKVIIIALLINFSMVISLAIVDLTNITANVFMNDVRGKINGNEQGKISAVFADSFFGGVTKTYKNCDEFKTESSSLCKDKDFLKAWHVNESICLAAATKGWESCQKTGSFTATLAEEDMLSFLDLFLQYTASSIVLIIAAFTFFAGGIMILFRVIAIWMLVIISPLALICYILPSLGSNWKKWWSTFLNWCIFAPVYTFFIWMATKIASSGANEMGKAAQIQGSMPMGSWSAISSELVSNPGAKLISYLVIVGFLVGGIIVSRQLGVIGSKTVMSLATDAKKSMSNWAKRKTIDKGARLGQIAGGATQRGAGSVLKKIPGFRTFGAKMEVKGKERQQKILKAKDVERAKKLYEQFSPEDLSNAMNAKIMNLSPAEKLALAQVVSSDKFRGKVDSSAAKRATQTLKTFGYEKDVAKIEDTRPEILGDKRDNDDNENMPKTVEDASRIEDRARKIEEKLKKLQENDKLHLISSESLKDKQVFEALEKLLGGTTAYFNWLNQRKRKIMEDENFENMLKRKMKDIKDAEKSATDETNKKGSQQTPPKP